jgi:hypothetical protein
MEPGDAFYGNTEADNVETPEEVAEVSQETPEETVVESEELESVASETKESAESLVYELGDREITQDQILEWEKGYLRQSDYTQKTQGIADKVKAETSKQVAEKLGDIDAKANTLVEHVNNLEAMLNEVEGNVNLDELREYDYEEYLKTKETIDNRRAKLKKATEDAQKAVDDANTARLTQEQRLLFESNPEWLDDKGQTTAKWEEASKSINDYARDAGYTAEEFGMLQSHKMMLTILEAAEYRRLKAKTTASKKVKTAPKLVKPTQTKSTKSDDTMSDGDRFYANAKR